MRRIDPSHGPLADRVERMSEWLFRTAVAGLCVLTAVQGLLLIPEVRPWLVPVERMEGAPAQTGPVASAEAEVSFQLADGASWPGAYVVVNGTPYGAFDKPEVRLLVREGDVLQVDARRAEGHRRIVVDHQSPFLLTPLAGQEWEVSGGNRSPEVKVHFIAKDS